MDLTVKHEETLAIAIPTISVLKFEEKHLADARELSRRIEWPHRLEDWAFYLGLGEGLVLLKEDDGTLVGTVLWFTHANAHATIGMLIIDPAWQGLGLGGTLMDKALQAQDVHTTVRLAATAKGAPLYAKLGFKQTGVVRQHQNKADAMSIMPLQAIDVLCPGLRSIGDEHFDEVIRLDEQAAGYNRSGLLKALMTLEGAKSNVLVRDGKVVAWSFFRPFGCGYLIGPVGAYNPDDAKTLISAWIAEFIRMQSNYKKDQKISAPILRIVVVGVGLSSWLDSLGLPMLDEDVAMEKPALTHVDANAPAEHRIRDAVPTRAQVHGTHPKFYAMAAQTIG